MKYFNFHNEEIPLWKIVKTLTSPSCSYFTNVNFAFVENDSKYFNLFAILQYLHFP